MDKMHKDEAMKTTSTDGSSTDEYDPRNPPYPPCPPPVGNSLSDSIRLVAKWSREKQAVTGALRASSIIFPDRIPKKIFLDTTRLIAKYTDNLLDELWNYIKEGKLAETAVLLLAAQEQIRKGTSRKRNGDSKPDGFAIIRDRILNNNITLHSEKGQQVEARIRLNNMALILVHVISKAGEGLDSYIQKHLEVPYFMQVPHSEVTERVSLILKDNGFCPTSECIEIGNLCPYEDVLSSEDIPNKPGESDTNREALEMDYLQTVVNKGQSARRKRKPRRWEHKLARRSFFPWWRSVLSARSNGMITPHKWARPSECLDLEMAWKKPTQGLDGETASKKATAQYGSAAAGPVMGRVPMIVYSSKPGELFTTIPVEYTQIQKAIQKAVWHSG